MTDCELCMNFEYDEEYEEYVCGVDVDEDDWNRLVESNYKGCPYFRMGDEYTIVRKQN